MTSQLFETSPIDVKDPDDERLERANSLVENMTRDLGEVDATQTTTNYASRGQSNHDEVQLGLLFAILTGTSSSKQRERAYRNMVLISRDGLNAIGDRVNALVREKWHRLLERPRSNIIWLAREFVEKQVSTGAKPDALCYVLLKQVVGGDVSPRNLLLVEGLLELFSKNRPWLETQSLLLASVVYAYMRMIPEHWANSALQQREVAFVAPLFRERFADCMQIGRDLVRAMLDLLRFREFEAIWRDMVSNPQSLAPQFEGINTLLRRKSSKKILANRVCGELESKVLFTLTQVRHAASRRHFEWLAKACFTSESQRTFRADLIRYVCCTFHPSNDLLQSDIVPRWSLITMILSSALGDRAAFHNCALALFWDWLFLDDARDIMLVEPGILVVQRAYRQAAPHSTVAFRCLETLLRSVKEFVRDSESESPSGSLKDLASLGLYENVRQSVNFAMRIVVEKAVIPPGSAAALLHTVNANGLHAARDVFSAEFFGMPPQAASTPTPAATTPSGAESPAQNDAPPANFSPPHDSEDDVVIITTERDTNREPIVVEDDSAKKLAVRKPPSTPPQAEPKREKENKAAEERRPTTPTPPPGGPKRREDKKTAGKDETDKRPLAGLSLLAASVATPPPPTAANATSDRKKPGNGDQTPVSDSAGLNSNASLSCTVTNTAVRGNIENLQRELALIGSDFVERRRRRSSDTHALPGELVELADEILMGGERAGDAELRRAFETLRSVADKQRERDGENEHANEAKLSEAVETALQTLVDDAEFADVDGPHADELVTKLARFLAATLGSYISDAGDGRGASVLCEGDDESFVGKPAFSLFRVLMELVYNKPADSDSDASSPSAAQRAATQRHNVAVRNRLFALLSRMQFAYGCDQLGYLLLCFLRSSIQRTDEKCTAYREYADYLMANMTRIRNTNHAGASSFGASRRPTSLTDCLLNDLRCCAKDDVGLLTVLAIYAFNAFEQELLGNVELIHTLVSSIDFSHMQELLNAIAQDSLLLFHDEHVVPVVQRSLEWESTEQSFLWDLLLLHQFDPSAYTPLLTKLSYSKNPEALAKMLHAFIDREPDLAMLCALLNRSNMLQSNWTRLGSAFQPPGSSRCDVDAFSVSVLASWCQKEVTVKRRSEVVRPKPQSAVAKPLRKLVELSIAVQTASATPGRDVATQSAAGGSRQTASRELLRLRDKLKEDGIAIPSLENILGNFDALRRQLKDYAFLVRDEIAAPLRDLVQRHPLVSSNTRSRFGDLLVILDTSDEDEPSAASSATTTSTSPLGKRDERANEREAHSDAAQRSLRDVPSRKAAAAEKQQDERNRSTTKSGSSNRGSHDRRPNRTARRQRSSSSSSSSGPEDDDHSEDEKDEDFLHEDEPNDDDDEEYQPSNAKRPKRNWNAD